MNDFFNHLYYILIFYSMTIDEFRQRMATGEPIMAGQICTLSFTNFRSKPCV
ncbi:MAG: hypothetical protein IJS92_05880 [Paludibacteraceae bacterium]|nr:hypothetical protein [Paludibacteraceae bacterium]